MKLNQFAALATLSTLFILPASAFDWGASLEESSGVLYPLDKPVDGAFNQSGAFKAWVNWNFGPDTTLLIKGSLSDSFKYGFDAKHIISNTLTPNLDTASLSSKTWWVGRSDLRDFGGTVLNTKVDGGQWTPSFGDLDLKLAVGTTASLFKASSSVVISQADLNDRAVDVDWSKPETIFASPRLMALAETTLPFAGPQPDPNAPENNAKGFSIQKLQFGEILQLDLRGGDKIGVADKSADTTKQTANVSMTYTGAGANGRVGGPLYWSAWTYLGLGTTLTPVSSVWKTTYIVNSLTSADLTWLLPEWSNSIINLGVQMGSWDEDGKSPDQNKPDGTSPTLYTGFVGVSRTGASLIFNPQPTNMVTTQLLWSIKPFAKSGGGLESLQVVANAFAFVRPTANAITEAGVKPTSTDLYLASEADLSLAIRPASDWGANLGLGVLLPNGQAMTRGTELKAQAGLNLSF